MVFFTNNPTKMGAGLERKLRKEVGCQDPLPYETHATGEVPNLRSAGEAFSTMAYLFAGGEMKPVVAFTFQVHAPRPFELLVEITRGSATVVGSLTYSMLISAPLSQPLSFEHKKGFAGEDWLIGHLRQEKKLVRTLKAFMRSSYRNGQVKSPPEFLLTPEGKGSRLTIRTLPRTVMFWNKFDVNSFLQVAERLEQAMGGAAPSAQA